jgi:hypothetical protein
LDSDLLGINNSIGTGIPDWPHPAGGNGADLPLFRRRVVQPGPAYPAAAATHVDPVRNPYFQNEPLQRLANLTTTRSNVYAVWLTIGFFEVEQVPPQRSALSSDGLAGKLNRFGYRLGNEVGWDTGDIRRHRAFYIIDRSIPVACEPGKTHNAEKSFLLKRFIE